MDWKWTCNRHPTHAPLAPVPTPVAEADRAEAHFAPRAHGPGITDASAAVVPSTTLRCPRGGSLEGGSPVQEHGQEAWVSNLSLYRPSKVQPNSSSL